MGLRNLYKVFRETRNAAREQATLAVTGDSARAAEVAALLGAQRGVRGAEVILAVRDDWPRRLALGVDGAFLAAVVKGCPPLRRGVSGEMARKTAHQNPVIGA